jgi:hypothetical protein
MSEQMGFESQVAKQPPKSPEEVVLNEIHLKI